MTARRNIAASVTARLKSLSQEDGRTLQELLALYGIERFLYRLSISLHSRKFVLKGALMLVAWHSPQTRPTMDIDLLGITSTQPESLAQIVCDVCSISVPEDDGLRFDPDTIRTERIKEDADYEGVRVLFRGFIGKVRIPMQIDVGFNDVITPRAELLDYPVLLDGAAPRLRGYNRESVIAEKFEAMVHLGILNSRMKDFYDIWLLSRFFSFGGEMLQKAFRNTFERRKTALVSVPAALTESFARDPAKQTQWAAFLRKTRIKVAPQLFADLLADLTPFLLPAAESIISFRDFALQWSPPGPWKTTREC